MGFIFLLISISSLSEEMKLYFGDTHLHTAYSFDAFLNDNDSAYPDTAYRWARGLPVIHPYTRTRVQIETPLDFLVVSDHAEYLGVITELSRDRDQLIDLGFFKNLVRDIQIWFALFMIDIGRAEDVFNYALPEPASGDGHDLVADPNGSIASVPYGDVTNIKTKVWQDIVKSAEEHYIPGIFTSFVGWEWTSTPTGANLHRVIISPDGAEKALKYLPYGSDVSQYPRDLWKWLDTTSKKLSTRFLAIPHNSNLSKGYMFDEYTLEGEPFDATYASMRIKWEPVVEVTQVKGDSESLPNIETDEFSNFETYTHYLQSYTSEYIPKKGDYVRSALKLGLKFDQTLGVNPYKFGLIGSTDSHTSLASAEEKNFWGKYSNDSTPEIKDQAIIGDADNSGWSMSAGGLAGVWAKENNREEIYAAFKRKEVFATTGPRIRLQIFGGWDFDGINVQNYQDIGYERGVPMGGDLYQTSLDAGPSFAIRVTKDPVGANLDRAQIIKGWIDMEGVTHEKIFDVAWSDERVEDEDGNLELVGNTVNLNTGTHENSIGATDFFALWQDPQFKKSERAFYYLRALEIPTARHSLLDALALQSDDKKMKPFTIQERAYSSPIWYNP